MSKRADHWGAARRSVRVTGLLVLAGTVLLSWHYYVKALAGHQSPTENKEARDIVSQMVDLTEKGSYDRAVEVGLKSLQGGSTDEAVYQQIADVFLIRAHKDPEKREQWVAKAVLYVDKAVSLNSKARDVAGVHILQDARIFELAGDLALLHRCGHYERAKKLLEDRVPLLQGEQVALEGRIFPLAPLRKENEKALAEVNAKAAKAGCQK